ncbi:collagen-binding domain-containing protein [Paludibacterium yongneupense]|uniref:collagen-binding domain-containing protein n=1 Tax=Paludibacterium yongneupense TaxID=400061 RepID=UPI000413CB36|nr:collagen-binding domain-containing protein [Paludibacterium yongneupense]
MMKLPSALLLASGLFAAAQANATLSFSSIAGSYNLFLSGNLGSSSVAYSGDTQGAMAVGGNAWLQSYSVAATSNASGTALVVGGSLTQNGGTINGNAYVGGNASFPTNYGGTTINGSLTYGGSLNSAPTQVGTTTHSASAAGTLDFNAAEATLQQTSAYLANSANFGASQTGTVSVAPWTTNNYVLTGTNSSLNVFTMTTAQLAALSSGSFTINAPSSSTVVINITGSSATFGAPGNFGFFLNGVSASHVLFNLDSATSVNISGLGVYGSILAPNAAVTFSNGQLNGTLMAASLSGSQWQGGQLNSVAFTGTLPTISPVPEPASYALFGLGFAGLLLRRRRKTH